MRDARTTRWKRNSSGSTCMANDLRQTATKCQACARNQKALIRKEYVQLFYRMWRLELTAMDMLGALQRLKNGNLLVMVLTHWDSKMTRPIYTSKKISTNVENLFRDRWLILYIIPDHLFTDNCSEFESAFFSTLCSFPGLKNLTATAYHSQNNGQVEKCNKVVITRLRH